ncbi:hypothetical protein EGW08_018512 [Elysia chlorotica]|uniref:Uncharacterized protein n=1 Tax=Elysia chlorotica TaxID=188477 RepID=A0A433SWT5_ELYCH|nr:hypothetical protein EGW08_018512 [Elysia chlorotica]
MSWHVRTLNLYLPFTHLSIVIFIFKHLICADVHNASLLTRGIIEQFVWLHNFSSIDVVSVITLTTLSPQPVQSESGPLDKLSGSRCRISLMIIIPQQYFFFSV